jgi:hypothetical protein
MFSIPSRQWSGGAETSLRTCLKRPGSLMPSETSPCRCAPEGSAVVGAGAGQDVNNSRGHSRLQAKKSGRWSRTNAAKYRAAAALPIRSSECDLGDTPDSSHPPGLHHAALLRSRIKGPHMLNTGSGLPPRASDRSFFRGPNGARPLESRAHIASGAEVYPMRRRIRSRTCRGSRISIDA